MNIKTRIAKFLITLTTFSVMTTVNAYQGSNCCDPCVNYNPCCPSSSKSFYVEADFIYWTVFEDGLRGLDLIDCANDCDCDGSGDNGRCNGDFDNDWNPGFKVGVGLANPCCDWDLFIQYTYYQATPHRHHDHGEFFDFFTGEIVELREAHDRWRLNFNNIDFLFSHEFCLNNCFTLRPQFGLKGAWIQNHLDNDRFPNEYPDNFGHRHRQRFWAVGPKVGFTAAASLFDCFNLYGNLGVSTVWGQYQSERHDGLLEEEVGITDNFCVRHCRYRVTPVLETSFGVRWDTDLCGDYGFYVNVAWEQQVWFDHNDFINFFVNSNHGNLTFQGVTVGAGFSF